MYSLGVSQLTGGSDLNFGVHDVLISANIVTNQTGPLLQNGSAQYLYLGCYDDGNGRQLQKQFSSPNNENGQCQTTCFKAGYMFAGTEYRRLFLGNEMSSANFSQILSAGFVIPSL